MPLRNRLRGGWAVCGHLRGARAMGAQALGTVGCGLQCDGVSDSL